MHSHSQSCCLHNVAQWMHITHTHTHAHTNTHQKQHTHTKNNTRARAHTHTHTHIHTYTHTHQNQHAHTQQQQQTNRHHVPSTARFQMTWHQCASILHTAGAVKDPRMSHTHTHTHTTYIQCIHTEETINKTHALSFNEMIYNRDQQYHAFSNKIWITACTMWIVTPLF